MSVTINFAVIQQPVRQGDGRPSNFRLVYYPETREPPYVLEGWFAWREIDAKGYISDVGGDWRPIETIVR